MSFFTQFIKIDLIPLANLTQKSSILSHLEMRSSRSLREKIEGPRSKIAVLIENPHRDPLLYITRWSSRSPSSCESEAILLMSGNNVKSKSVLLARETAYHCVRHSSKFDIIFTLYYCLTILPILLY